MKKKIISIITTVVMLMCAFPVSVAYADMNNNYMDIVNGVITTYGSSEESNNSYATGLIYGEFIDFDNNGTEEMLLIYKEKVVGNAQKYNWATALIYGMVDNKPVKLLEEDIYGSLGQTDVSYMIGIKDVNGQKYVSFNAQKPSLEYGDCENIIVFTMADEKAITDKYYAEVLPWWDSFEFVYTKCTINDNSVTEEDYKNNLEQYYYNSYRLLLFPGTDFEDYHFCSQEKLSDFLAVAEAKYAKKAVTVTLNGEEIAFDQPPVIVDGRTLVPIRAVIEAMNGVVEWDEATQTVTLSLGSDTIKLVIGSTTAYLNEKAEILDVPPQVINGRTLLPIRFVAEKFKFNVDWSEETQTVVITTKSVDL